MSKPTDFGLVFFHRELRHFLDYKFSPMKKGAQILEVTLTDGEKGLIKDSSFKGREGYHHVKAIDAIRRYPLEDSQDGILR